MAESSGVSEFVSDGLSEVRLVWIISGEPYRHGAGVVVGVSRTPAPWMTGVANGDVQGRSAIFAGSY